MTSAPPRRIATSIRRDPATMSPNPAHPTRGQATRLPSRIGPAKYRTATSKKMIQKMSMFIPWNVSAR